MNHYLIVYERIVDHRGHGSASHGFGSTLVAAASASDAIALWQADRNNQGSGTDGGYPRREIREVVAVPEDRLVRVPAQHGDRVTGLLDAALPDIIDYDSARIRYALARPRPR